MQITHQIDPITRRYVQIVTPAQLRRILDQDGDNYERPADFSDDDEWEVATD